MLWYRKITFLLLGVLLMWGCSPLNSLCAEVEEISSGIQGQVWLAPTCPEVFFPKIACQARPYVAIIAIYNEEGQLVHRVQSNEAGYFRVALPPGSYRLHPESSGLFPQTEEQTVTITQNQITQITINYDSGIR